MKIALFLFPFALSVVALPRNTLIDPAGSPTATAILARDASSDTKTTISTSTISPIDFSTRKHKAKTTKPSGDQASGSNFAATTTKKRLHGIKLTFPDPTPTSTTSKMMAKRENIFHKMKCWFKGCNQPDDQYDVEHHIW